MATRQSSLVNYVVFQLGWFACIMGAARGAGWLGPLAAVLVIALHLALSRRADLELRLLVVCFVLGLLLESLVMNLGLIRFEEPSPISFLAPLWITAMWPLFGTTLNRSLSFLHGRTLVSVVMGGIGGPLAYYAGAQLGAVTLIPTTGALLAYAVGWAVLMPVLVHVARRLNAESANV